MATENTEITKTWPQRTRRSQRLSPFLDFVIFVIFVAQNLRVSAFSSWLEVDLRAEFHERQMGPR